MRTSVSQAKNEVLCMCGVAVEPGVLHHTQMVVVTCAVLQTKQV